MAAGNRNAGRLADRCAAFKDLAHYFRGNFVHRHSQNCQRHDRRAAHGIDVRERVGGGDAAEVERIVYHRHEEVGGRDHAGAVVELPDAGIVAGFNADQQLLVVGGGGMPGQQLLQDGGRQLTSAAAAVGELAETDGLHDVHGGGSESSLTCR